MPIAHSPKINQNNGIMPGEELYQQYITKMRRIADVKNTLAVMQWDQETYLPPKGAALRGEQMATLSEIAHEMFAEEELGKLLRQLSELKTLSFSRQRNAELTLEDYNKNKKYSAAFVRKLSEATSRSYHSWGIVTIDAEKNIIAFDASDEEIAKRRAAWKMPPYKANRGTLAKYIRLVKNASNGCVTDEEL